MEAYINQLVCVGQCLCKDQPNLVLKYGLYRKDSSIYASIMGKVIQTNANTY